MIIRRHVKVAALTAFAAIGIPLAAMSATQAAAAERTDNAFVGRVSDMGIGFTKRDTVITAGHGVCRALSGGQTAVSAIHSFSHRTRLTDTQASAFVTVAVHTYCPEFAGRLPTS